MATALTAAALYTAADYAADLEYWSCLHRDAYGFRPRTAPPAMEDMPARVAEAQAALELGLRYEAMSNRAAQQRYEHNVRYHMMADGLDRPAAARTVQNRALREGHYRSEALPAGEYDAGQVCYELGLCYGLEHQMRADYEGTLLG